MTQALGSSDEEVFTAGQTVAVLLPLPLAGAYDYRVPPDTVVQAGDFVQVPLGKRQEIGVVWGAGSSHLPSHKIKPLIALLEEAPRLPLDSRKMVDWVAAYTLSPPGAVLKMVVPVPAALTPPKGVVRWQAVMPPPLSDLKLTAARQKALDLARTAAKPLALADFTLAGVSAAVVKRLHEGGLLSLVQQAEDGTVGEGRVPDGDHPGPLLSVDQQRAAEALVARVGQGFSTTVLQGVTGSGKTEVYFEAIAAALRLGLQVLVLVPEITLTAQWLHRFAARFGAPPLEWHSEVSPARRRRFWRAVASGTASVVVGARSALFLPYRRLGLIIVDEEHEPAYKQEEGVVYHGRDMAVVRGHLGSLPVVLASATPSLETMVNVQAGRYRLVKLAARHGKAVLPRIEMIDLRRFPPEKGDWGRGWLSPPLVRGLTETLERGEQAMVFLNRRGYAPLTLCRKCGYRIQCPCCSAWLVEHRRQGKLVCHHCGHASPPPRVCPSCGAEDEMAACGPGVERVAEEVAARFPQARSVLVASDTIAGPQAASDLVKKVVQHEIDILIGTQVLAKGLHFPLLTFVGVVDADLGLAGGDLRASERTFQLLSQVAGRAGRSERPGTVMVQTYQPQHPVLVAMVKGDGEAFLREESFAREMLLMPPFGRMAALVISGEQAEAVETVAHQLAQMAPTGEGIEVLGPAPAPLSLLRGRTRWRLLLKTARHIRVQSLLRHWMTLVDCPHHVKIQIDVDPYNFL